MNMEKDIKGIDMSQYIKTRSDQIDPESNEMKDALNRYGVSDDSELQKKEERRALETAKPETKNMSEITFGIYDKVCGTIGNAIFEITGRNRRKAKENRKKLKERLLPIDSD
jgi:hypothetical protein